MIVPILMSGGAGTRLWPLSRRASPKQFHALGSGGSLIQETARRFQGPGFAAPVVVGAAEHADLARRQLAAVGAEPALIVSEPAARGTGPAAVAAVAAAARAFGPDALLLIVHADNQVADVAALHRLVELARPQAEAGDIVLFGIRPTGPETGYGYIRAGEGEGPVRPVERFVEKPDLATARAYVQDPAYSWNGGMFLFRAEAFLREARLTAPDVAGPVEALVAAAPLAERGLSLASAYAAVPDISIDHAVMERSRRVAVVTADIGWSDLGNWTAVWEGAPRTPNDEALTGDVLTVGASRNLVRTDGPTVVLSGVSGLVVVVENGVVLVTSLDNPKGAGEAVAHLRAAGREDLL